MKKLINSSILFLLLISNGFSQDYGWQSLDFVAQEKLLSVKSLSEDTVIIVGENGYIIRTTDGGQQWTQITSNTVSPLNKVDFINDTLGFILGNNGTILKTIDAGVSWVDIGIETQLNFRDFSAINTDTFWVAGGDNYSNIWAEGEDGILLKTTNCGINWSIDSSFNSAIHSVSFVNSDTGYICTNSLKRTINSGLTFENVDPQINEEEHYGTINNVRFFNDSTGFITMNSTGGIFKTTDFGNTWQIVSDQWGIFDFKILDICTVYCLWYDMPGEGSGWVNSCDNNIESIIETYYFNDVSFINNIGFGAGGYTGYSSISEKRICKWDVLNDNYLTSTRFDFDVIPNPSNGIIKIFLPPKIESFEVAFIDLKGETLQKTQNSRSLDLTDFATGTYIIEVIGDNFIKRKKIIIY